MKKYSFWFNVNLKMDANYPKGLCTQMCPEEEIALREREGLLHILEVIPSTANTRRPKANRKFVVKEFTRSAAGRDTQDVTKLRTIEALLQTINYLLHDVITVQHIPWNTVYDFIMDRLRAIRQDMVIQNFNRTYCISILQPMIRFYVYSSYRLCEEAMSIYDPVINNNQLLECLKRLLCLYDEADALASKALNFTGHDQIYKCNALFSACRPFMESLYLINNLGSTTAMERTLHLPKIWRTSLVKKAFTISLEYWRGNFVRVCHLILKLPPLLAASAVLHLPAIRRKSLVTMSTAYNTKTLRFPAEKLQELFLYNDLDEVFNECSYYNIPVVESNIIFSKSAFNHNNIEPSPKHCTFVDELLSKYPLPYLLLEDEIEETEDILNPNF